MAFDVGVALEFVFIGKVVGSELFGCVVIIEFFITELFARKVELYAVDDIETMHAAVRKFDSKHLTAENILH